MEVEEFEHAHTVHMAHWNGYDVEELVDGLVLNTGIQHVASRKNIRGPLNITHHLNISGTLLGHRFKLII